MSKTIDKVRQSELGMFINLIYEDIPVEDITSLEELADRISEGFNVDCKEEDIQNFYSLDDMKVELKTETNEI